MKSAMFVSHTGEKGGAEIFLIDLLKAGPQEWQACFLSDGSALDELVKSGRQPLLLKVGQKMLSVRRGSSPRALAAAALDVFVAAWKLSREARNYDVICANSQKSLFVCALAAKLSGRPLVWFLHDIITDAAFSASNRRASLAFARFFAQRVGVNSLETGKAFISAGGQADKVRTVYNGFDPDAAPVHDPQLATALRAKLGLDDRPLVGLFGRLSEWKGQHVLLEALARTADVQAVIVGGALFGQQAYEREIQALATRLGLDDRVRFLGFRDDVQTLMAAMDIVVHTSITPEPFGRVVVEGMLAGRPVIATIGGGVTEIVRDGRTGLLVPPGDVGALTAAIDKIISDPNLAAMLSTEGRKDVATRFSLKTTLNSVANILAEVG